MPFSESVKRSIAITEKALRTRGFQVVPFFLTDEVWAEARDLMNAIQANKILPEMFSDLQASCEVLNDSIQAQIDKLSYGFVTRLLRDFTLKVTGQRRMAANDRGFTRLSKAQFEDVIQRKEEFAKEISKKWRKLELAALVSPVFPTCAPLEKYAAEMTGMNEYTAIWNLIDFPCGVMPISKVREDEEFFKDHYEDRWTHLLHLNSVNSAKMPICLQIVGHSHEDEKVLGIMKVLDLMLHKTRIRIPIIEEDDKDQHFRIMS